jgi:hypothetical protein
MSTDTPQSPSSFGDYTLTELRNMDEATAKTELSYQQFQTWESLNDKLDEHEDRVAEWQDADADVTDTIVFADRSDLATDVNIMGNDLAVYYGPTDDDIRDAAEALQERFDIDTDDELTVEDVPDGAVEFVEARLADLITAAVVEWNGTHWNDLGVEARDDIHERIREKWGTAALMDAWVEIQVSVEDNRNERLERIEKFRNPTRRGDR